MRNRLTLVTTALLLGAVGAAPAASAAPDHGDRQATAAAAPRLIPLPDADHFRARVTNRYYPLAPGTRWIYRGFGSEGHERDVVVVLRRTKRIEGIDATVVRDVVRHRGRLIERTFDWFGQDRRGRVWYLGENTHAYEDGHVSTAGSWQAGVAGAHAGVVMFPHPVRGRAYWQEFDRGNAEDTGRLLASDVSVAVGGRHYDRVRMTEDTTPLEPRVEEFKFYAPGVGTVLEVDTSPEVGRVELVRVVRP